MPEYSKAPGLRRRRGFTLIEALTATMMFAIIVGAVYASLYSSIRLREAAHRAFESTLPIDYALSIVRRDLEDALPPAGLLAGEFVGELVEESSRRLDTLTLHTASGTLSDEAPWGATQKVEYYLQAPEDSEVEGYELVRAVTRNLLPSIEQEPEITVLASALEGMELEYYDGEEWQDSWDSTTEENLLPKGARLTLLALAETTDDLVEVATLFVPFTMEAPAAEESGDSESAEPSNESAPAPENAGGAGGGASGGGSGGAPPPGGSGGGGGTGGGGR